MAGLVSPVLAQEAPLPDMDTLWKSVKPYLMRHYDDQILRGYTYRRHALVSELGKGESVKKTEESEAEIYFFDHGPFTKFISRNGIPLSDKELKKQDAEFRKFQKKGPGRGGPPWRGRRLRSPKEQEELLNDVYNAFDFQLLRREPVRGRNTLVVHFKPKKNPKLKTMVARLFLTKMEGTAWIDELDHRIARVDADFIKDTKLAFGILASVGDESHYRREWIKVNDEVWLPTRSEARVKGRLFLAKGINLRIVEEFSDYRKFSVETTIKVDEESLR
jgi:hypothetical protein